jgi:hypothetical protein
MDDELKRTLWFIVAIDVLIVMVTVMHHFPKPPVM